MKTLRNMTFIILGALAIFLVSCQEASYFTESQPVPGGVWTYTDTLVFSPEVEQAGQPVDISLWVRHSKEYAYSNLWVKVISDHDLAGDSTGLVELIVADKFGAWLGSCGQSLCTVTKTLASNHIFESPASFRVEVVQYMRDRELAGVNDVGLVITPHVPQPEVQ